MDASICTPNMKMNNLYDIDYFYCVVLNKSSLFAIPFFVSKHHVLTLIDDLLSCGLYIDGNAIKAIHNAKFGSTL